MTRLLCDRSSEIPWPSWHANKPPYKLYEHADGRFSHTTAYHQRTCFHLDTSYSRSSTHAFQTRSLLWPWCLFIADTNVLFQS